MERGALKNIPVWHIVGTKSMLAVGCDIKRSWRMVIRAQPVPSIIKWMQADPHHGCPSSGCHTTQYQDQPPPVLAGGNERGHCSSGQDKMETTAENMWWKSCVCMFEARQNAIHFWALHFTQCLAQCVTLWSWLAISEVNKCSVSVLPNVSSVLFWVCLGSPKFVFHYIK